MLSYEKGTIHFMSEVVTGQTRMGSHWANMTLVLSVSTSATTYKYLALKVSTDRVDDVRQFNVGDKVEVGFSVSGREWEGKWYANVELVNIKADEGQFAKAASAPQARPQSMRQMSQIPAAPAPMQYGQGELDPANYDDIPFLIQTIR